LTLGTEILSPATPRVKAEKLPYLCVQSADSWEAQSLVEKAAQNY
jgi:hypothetical protein